MYVVLVVVSVRPERGAAFAEALLENARLSIVRDPGCSRFDVSQDVEDPNRWVMHEVYDSPAAHAAHRQSSHFLRYDAVAAEAVVHKLVVKADARHLPA